MTEAFGGETEPGGPSSQLRFHTAPKTPRGRFSWSRIARRDSVEPPLLRHWEPISARPQLYYNLLYDPILQWRKGGRCLEGWAASPAKDAVSGARLPPRLPLPLPLGTAPLCSASKIGGGCG